MFESLQSDLMGALMRQVRQRVDKELPWLGSTKLFVALEGSTVGIRKGDNGENVEFEHYSSAFNVDGNGNDIESMDSLMIQMEKIAIDVARKLARSMYALVEKSAAAVGNTVSGGGGPISADLLIRGFEKLDIDFDEDGMPLWPPLHISPSNAEVVKRAIEDIERDPVLAQRMNAFVEEKRHEWLAREGNRTLAG